MTFTGYTPGQTVPVSMRVRPQRSPSGTTTNSVGFKANGVLGRLPAGAPAGEWSQVNAAAVADGSGNVVVQTGFFDMAVLVGFDGFNAYCEGLEHSAPSAGSIALRLQALADSPRIDEARQCRTAAAVGGPGTSLGTALGTALGND